jgi:hypothetical protein
MSVFLYSADMVANTRLFFWLDMEIMDIETSFMLLLLCLCEICRILTF